MAETTAVEFRPDWVSPPGQTIADLLDEKGWTQAELSVRTGFTKKHVNELVSGKAAISPDAALRLEATVGGGADFWLVREAQYREAMERRASEQALEAYGSWLKELPLRDMIRFKWIRKCRAVGAQVSECLRFFGVATVDAWRAQYQTPVLFRISDRVRRTAGALSAWLRQGERQAAAIACGVYDGGAFRNALRDLRGLTLQADPEVFVPRLVERCASVGVAVVFVPTPRGCPAWGATRWLSSEKALLQLSLRYKTNDHLWFTFFHEAGHIVLHGKKMLFIEGAHGRDEEESEADNFACQTLIPHEFSEQLRGLRGTHANVAAFAQRVGVAPGIVVGRLQSERLIPWSHLNDMKVRYRWRDEDEG